MLHPSEIAKLVHVYLKDEGFSKTCEAFESECQHISDGMDLPFSKIGKVGANLTSILNDFLIIKETEIELERNEALSVLQSLWKQLDSLIAQLKYASMKGNLQPSRKLIFSQSVRSKKAALSRETAIYKMKSMEFKENRTGKSAANSFVQKPVLTEDVNRHSNIKKSLANSSNSKLGRSDPGQPKNVSITSNFSKAISAQDGALLEVRNSQRGNCTYPTFTPPRITSNITGHQVPFIPPTPGAFLLQQPMTLNLGSSSDMMRNTPVEPVSDAHAVTVCSNQLSNDSCVTPLRTNNQNGSAAGTPLSTHQYTDSVSGIPPTPGTFLVPLQNSVPAVPSRSEGASDCTDTDHVAEITQVQAFSNQTLIVTSGTASVTTVTDIGRQPLVTSNTSTSDAASVTMEMPVDQYSLVSPSAESLSISNTSHHQQAQNSTSSHKSLEVDCETSFVETNCTFEVVEEGQSESLVSKQQENNLLNTEGLNEGDSETTCFRSKQGESSGVSRPGFISPQKGDLGLEDLNLAELQLRSPRRKCPQPKKRSAATDSPSKFVDGGQKTSNKGEVVAGIPESGNAAMPAILETLLGTPSLQEKLAENINRVVARHDGPDINSKDEENVPQQTDESQPADIPVDDILALMQADPAFEALFAPDVIEDREDPDAVTEKTDVHAEVHYTCSLPAETSSPSDSKSTLSNSATLVSDALLLLSHNHQSEGSQVQSRSCVFGDIKAESPPTTSEVSVNHEPALPVLLTTDDTGLTLPSTTIASCGVGEVNSSVKEPGKAKTRKSPPSRPLSPLKSHVRSLNFGKAVTGKPNCKKKSHQKSQKSPTIVGNTGSSICKKNSCYLQKTSTVLRNTGNSDPVENTVPQLANQQSNNSAPLKQGGMISQATPPMLSDGRKLDLLTASSLSHGSQLFTSLTSVQPSCAGPVRGESSSQIVVDVSPLHTTAQETQNVVPLYSGQQVTQSHKMSNPAAFHATVQENANATVIHPHRTANMAPMQDALNTALAVCSPQSQTQGTSNATQFVSNDFQHTPSGYGMCTAPQDFQGTTRFHMCISSQDSQTASAENFVSQHATHSTEVVSQLSQPIMTATTQRSTMHMVSSSRGMSPTVGSQSESDNKNGGMLRALQLSAEQDAKSLFGRSKSLNMFSAAEYIIQLSKQYASVEDNSTDSEKHSSPPLAIGLQTQEFASVSNLNQISSPSSAPFVTESCCPVTFSQQMAKTQQRQSSVPIGTTTLSPVTCYTSVPPQFNRYVTQNACCTIPTSDKGSHTLNHPFSEPVSSSYTGSRVNAVCVATSSTLQQPVKQSNSSNVTTVTSNSNADSLNISSPLQEQNKNMQSSNDASNGQFAVTSEREPVGTRNMQSPVNMAADSPASSYCSEISVPTPDGSEGKSRKGRGKRPRSITPENKKKKSKHSRTSKKPKKKSSTDIPRNLENLDVDKFLSKLHYIEK